MTAGLDYYARRIKACGLALGMRVNIGNGREGAIVAFGHWVQGVCVLVDGARGPVWNHYEDTIPVRRLEVAERLAVGDFARDDLHPEEG